MCHLRKSIHDHKKIESLPHLNLGKPKTKSIKISIQNSLGIGNVVYKPWDCTRDFVCL